MSPSVVASFGFFAPQDRQIVHDPRVRIVIDDGRRYLQRSGRLFDVITIDPPPPIEAAGSSLLYSTEFYRIAKAHLAPGGILQQWFPDSSGATLAAAARSLQLSFRYVVTFRSIEDWGYHFIASDTPIPQLTPTAFATSAKSGEPRSDGVERDNHACGDGLADPVAARQYRCAAVY